MDATSLSRRLAALPALAMRRVVLREVLVALPPDEAARLCGALVRRGADGAPFDAALLALNAVLDAQELGYDLHRALYAEATSRGDTILARLLLSPTPPPAGTPEAVPLDPGRAPPTLGMRKQLARGPIERTLLDRLLRDPDPQVIELLLGNPRVTEADAVRMAARRPTHAEAQRCILACERFIARYEVRRALAFNPYTPSDLAGRLVPLLNRRDLKELATDPQVSDTVRLAAAELLADLP